MLCGIIRRRRCLIRITKTANGKHTFRVVERLGTLADIAARSGDQDPLEWAKARAAQLTREAKLAQTKVVIKYSDVTRNAKGKQLAYSIGYLFLQDLCSKLGFAEIGQALSKGQRFQYDIGEILGRLVQARVLFPASKRASYESFKRFLEPPEFSEADVYRALRVMTKNIDVVQQMVYDNSKRVVPRDSTILYYDCTNYFFEIEEEDELRAYGKCKRNQPLPIIQMGLFMEASGIPLAFSLFRGNKSEQGSLKPLEEQIIKDFRLSKFVVCTDAGLSSHDNRVFNTQGERSFVTTQSIKTLPGHLKNWALDPTGWSLLGAGKRIDAAQHGTAVNGEIDLRAIHDSAYQARYFKTRWINEKKLEQQLMVSYSPKYAHYQQSVREQQVSRAIKKMAKPSTLKRKGPNDPARFISEVHVTDDGELASQDLVYLDQATVDTEAQYDGFYAVCTNLEASPEDIMAINEGRWQIEESFRIMKSEFRTRPVYLKSLETIPAHFLTCFLGLLVHRILHYKVKQHMGAKAPTGEEMLKQLRDMWVMQAPGDGYIPQYQRTDFTDALHEIFGFQTDTEIVRTKRMKQIVKKTREPMN